MFVNSIKEIEVENHVSYFFFRVLNDRKTSELICIEHAYIKLTILRDNRTTSDDDVS